MRSTWVLEGLSAMYILVGLSGEKFFWPNTHEESMRIRQISHHLSQPFRGRKS